MERSETSASRGIPAFADRRHNSREFLLISIALPDFVEALSVARIVPDSPFGWASLQPRRTQPPVVFVVLKTRDRVPAKKPAHKSVSLP